jgi:hypothetical protein
MLMTVLQATAQRADVRISPPDSPAHTTPAIVAFHNGLVCVWQQPGLTHPSQLRRWDPAGNELGEVIPHVPPEHGKLSFTYPISIVQSWHDGGSTTTVLPGNAAITDNDVSGAQVHGPYGSSQEFKSSAVVSIYSLARPGPFGWQIVDSVRHSNYSNLPPYNINATVGTELGYNPESRENIVLLERRDYGNPNDPDGTTLDSRLRGYDSNGTYWEEPNISEITPSSILLPVSGKEYLQLDTMPVRYISKVTVMYTFSLPLNDHLHIRYFKLFGPYFARTSWSAADTTRFRIEKFDLHGNLLDMISLPRTEYRDDYMLVQSRRDSMIAVLFGGSSGVRGSFVTSDLQLRTADTLLSATTGTVSYPAGAFRNDTLFVVWEDYRDGVSRIYGTFHRLGTSAIAGVVSRPDRLQAERNFIIPNPTDGTIHLNANFPQHANAEFELVNLLGEIVQHQQIGVDNAGWQSIPIDMNDLPAGAYIARLRHGSGVYVQMIVKK